MTVRKARAPVTCPLDWETQGCGRQTKFFVSRALLAHSVFVGDKESSAADAYDVTTNRIRTGHPHTVRIQDLEAEQRASDGEITMRT